MQVICLEDEAFYQLIDNVVERIQENLSIKEDKWLSPEQAMSRLKITSKTTLQKYRDQGRIRYSQPDKRTILYDSDSLNEFLEKHAKNTF
jgi:hypothetical protein